MGFIGMTAAIMNNVLRESKKTKVCRCPNCKNIIKRYLPDTQEKSIDLPPLVRCTVCGKTFFDPHCAEIALLSPENAFRAAANGYAGTWCMELHKEKYALSRLRKSMDRLSADDGYLREILSLQGISPDCYYAVFNSGRLRFNTKSGQKAPDTLT